MRDGRAPLKRSKPRGFEGSGLAASCSSCGRMVRVVVRPKSRPPANESVLCPNCLGETQVVRR